MLKLQRLIIAVSLASLVVSSHRACGQFDELIRRVPDSANAVVILNAKKIFASPMAVREGWQGLAGAGVDAHDSPGQVLRHHRPLSVASLAPDEKVRAPGFL